jgi:hypothetical protein
MRIFAVKAFSRRFIFNKSYPMKAVFLLIFFFILNSPFAQNFFVQQLDHFFPNRKSKQIEHLKIQNDSLKRANDSLTSSVALATEKMVHLKKELIGLKTELYSEKERATSAKEQLENEVSELLDSISKINFSMVTCLEETLPGANPSTPVILNRCTWRHFQIVERGVADIKGRYVWETETFDLSSGTPVKITTSALFKTEKVAELERKLNIQFEADYNVVSILKRGLHPLHFHKCALLLMIILKLFLK